MTDKLDIFLSSSQKEFANARVKLSKTICNIPFLKCLPLENSGADVTDVLEASLKATRNCDIYVGIFGSLYSEITIREYNAAVTSKKPCLTYVKKVRHRNKKLDKFIKDELKSQLKFHEFLNDNELVAQVQLDLERFMFETLTLRLNERVKNKKVTADIIEMKEEINPSFKDPFAEAESAFSHGNYLECLVRTMVVIEWALKIELGNSLRARSINLKDKTMGQLIQFSEEIRVITLNQASNLQSITHSINVAIHQGDFPDKRTASWALKKAKQIVFSFDIKP